MRKIRLSAKSGYKHSSYLDNSDYLCM